MTGRSRLALLVGSTVLLWAVSGMAQTDHLKCYKVKDPLKIRRGDNPRNIPWLDLGTEFGNEDCRIVGGFRLFCVPVTKTVTSSIETKLPGSPFAPTTISPLPSPEEIVEDKQCYKIKCNYKFPEPPNPSQMVTDQFGTRTVEKLKPFLLCGPADKNFCGDNDLDGTEQCDGTADAACPGQCQSDCTCGGSQICGNNTVEGTEQCDGTADSACPGFCQPDCTCGANPFCGDTAPACQGDCPAGQTCAADASFACNCVPETVTACGDTASECGGTCPSGETCGATFIFPISPPDYLVLCGCLPNGSFPCTNSTSPACGGDCPSGQSCTDSGGYCVCG